MTKCPSPFGLVHLGNIINLQIGAKLNRGDSSWFIRCDGEDHCDVITTSTMS